LTSSPTNWLPDPNLICPSDWGTQDPFCRSASLIDGEPPYKGNFLSARILAIKLVGNVDIWNEEYYVEKEVTCRDIEFQRLGSNDYVSVVCTQDLPPYSSCVLATKALPRDFCIFIIDLAMFLPTNGIYSRLTYIAGLLSNLLSSNLYSPINLDAYTTREEREFITHNEYYLLWTLWRESIAPFYLYQFHLLSFRDICDTCTLGLSALMHLKGWWNVTFVARTYTFTEKVCEYWFPNRAEEDKELTKVLYFDC